jgi:very-short-patch-repair endonuclease
MARIYTRKNEQEKRRYLRNNMPKSEVLLWEKLKNKQMNGERFLRQYSVDHYVLDFYCPRLKLAIEVDGDSHFIGNAQEYDKERQSYIEALGIRFLRFTNTDVCKNIDGVCQTIWEKIDTQKEGILQHVETKVKSTPQIPPSI